MSASLCVCVRARACFPFAHLARFSATRFLPSLDAFFLFLSRFSLIGPPPALVFAPQICRTALSSYTPYQQAARVHVRARDERHVSCAISGGCECAAPASTRLGHCHPVTPCGARARDGTHRFVCPTSSSRLPAIPMFLSGVLARFWAVIAFLLRTYCSCPPPPPPPLPLSQFRPLVPTRRGMPGVIARLWPASVRAAANLNAIKKGIRKRNGTTEREGAHVVACCPSFRRVLLDVGVRARRGMSDLDAGSRVTRKGT